MVRARGVRRALVLLALGALLWASSTPVGHAAERATHRVLFIGNSYTRFNNLPRMVQRLSRSAPSGPVLVTNREARGGFDLRMHWRDRRVRRRIASGRYEAVVLQGHSLEPLSEPDEMAAYAHRFAQQATRSGARLVLFQTWARAPKSREYRRLGLGGHDEMLARVDSFYSRLGRELHAPVAPVGRAWRRAHEAFPDLRLYRRDGTHPTLSGSYLAAAVLYGTLAGVDPRQASWEPWPLSATEGSSLRAIAAESLGYR